MIKTYLDPDDLEKVLDLGYKFHQESQYKDLSYDIPKITNILMATISIPTRFFIAYDAEFKGLILLQMSTQFFSASKWAGDQAFYVVPEARKSGLGHDLLEVGYQWACDNDADDFVILHNAGIGLETAQKFYEKEGFKLSGMIFNKKVY
jgi:GNAT superfamily N-acetyltransferase